MIQVNNEYWDKFYKDFKINEPSTFATFVAGLGLRPDLVLDVGCGNGRDTHFLSTTFDCKVVALDGSTSAINHVSRMATELGLERVISARHFVFGQDSPNVIEGDLSRETVTEILVYARFVLHAVDDAGEVGFWGLISKIVAEGGAAVTLALEYRTPEDAELPKETPAHYRRFVDYNRVSEKAQELGFRLEFQETGRGLSVYGSDDHHLCRQVFVIG